MATIHKKILDKAKEIALTSDVRRGKICAIILSKNGHVHAIASNSIIKGDENGRKTFTIHAERFVFAKAIKKKIFERNRLSDLVLLVVRVRPGTGKFANAKPCKHCQPFIKACGIKTYFTNKDGQIERYQ